MMFPKLSILATSLMVTLAVADYPAPGSGTSNQCCSVVGTALNSIIAPAALLLGANLIGAANNIGFGCTGINIASNVCSTTAVNCNSSPLGTGGLIYVGCVPITI